MSSVALLLKQTMCFSIWQEHDKQSISPELVHAAAAPPDNPRMHSVSCYCTQSHIPLLKPTIFRGCWSVSTASPARWKDGKCGAAMLKKWMQAEYASPRRCIILVDGAPVSFMLWTMNAAQDDKKPLPRIWFVVVQKKTKKCDWFFICTCLSECQEWM